MSARVVVALWVLLAGCAADEPARQIAADAAASDGDAARGDATPLDAPPDAALADAAPPDAALADAAPPDAAAPACATPVRAAPIASATGVWQWVPIGGMRCADGSATGIGLNRAPDGARRLFVYLAGGGACWDEASCYRNGSAAFIEGGFDAGDFAQLGLTGSWFFDRANRDNPFADHHHVFVPYCTGDLHAGDRVAAYGGRATHHVGAVNYEVLLARLAATFPDVERVVVSGGSAGGYGALFNAARTRAAFPCARVDVVDDSGPPLPPPHLPPALQATWSEAWNLPATLPPGCPGCVADWSRLVPEHLAAQPAARVALLTTMRDGVIAAYMGLTGDATERGVRGLVDAVAAPRFGAFLVEGDGHVLLGSHAVSDGQSVPAWLRAMQADEPAWGTVGPDPLPACSTLADCGACAVCAAQGPCQPQFRACEARGGCVDAVVCALQCPGEDATCITRCAALAPDAGDQAAALYVCARCQQCPDDCGRCP